MTDRIRMPLIYKPNLGKATRTSHNAARGIGLDAALEIFSEIKARFGCPPITDIHEADQCAPVAQVVDILQIPGFLGRQTDLLLAGANTGADVNVAKVQFLAPFDIANVVPKLKNTGNERILLVERGASFGYVPGQRHASAAQHAAVPAAQIPPPVRRWQIMSS
jgi:2-dehydro-3-deoxyphosphooctonate aldolase (KDO 8-P synthase)